VPVTDVQARRFQQAARRKRLRLELDDQFSSSDAPG
jgi:hypothetical protein